jgi:hypothetical protein
MEMQPIDVLMDWQGRHTLLHSTLREPNGTEHQLDVVVVAVDSTRLILADQNMVSSRPRDLSGALFAVFENSTMLSVQITFVNGAFLTLIEDRV